MRFSLRLAPTFTIVACLCLPFGASAAENSLQAVFARMDQESAKFKGMTADMRRLSHEGVINEDDPPDIGTIAVKIPKPHDVQMLIEFKQPDPKAVEISGSKVLIYYPKAAEVQEYNLGKARRGQMEQFLKLGFGSTSRELEDAYTVTYGGRDKIEGQDTTRLELAPKSPDLAAQFPKFELWISDSLGISVQQKIFQPGGSYNIATYSHVQLNPDLPESMVRLNLPKGVKRTVLSR